MTIKFVQHYRNAKTCIAQIRRGEWKPRWNPIGGEYMTAHRGDMELWIANGGWFVDIDRRNYFGLLFRHWVWIAAARKLRGVTTPTLTDDAQ